ncbi:TolC family protein [Variovorax sp. J22R133]|uniref:TolC family protein n=1 Tax=Variovorax brevis TaxID=3053503 RepID=UPI0025785DDC|nr:TolC family protein [Variovorax sp. J22R133]MDM0111539.1 TolC family protein [Variovorax sp. J22R133]
MISQHFPPGRLSGSLFLACLLGASLPAFAERAAPPVVSLPAAVSSTHPSEVLVPRGAPESLQDLLTRTLEQDPQLQVSNALLGVSEERRVQARSRLAPVLNVQGSYGKSRESVLGRTVDGKTDQSSASLRWNLFNAGNDVAEFNGSTQDVAAAQQDVRRAREEIGERIASAYAELLRHEELIPHSLERMREAKRLVDQVKRANELGKLADVDASQAQAALLDAQVAHGQLMADMRAAQSRMVILTGDDLRPTKPVKLPVSYLISPASGASGLVAAAQLRADAADERVLPWLSSIAPRIDFQYDKQLSNRTSPGSDPTQLSGWQVVARWDLPLGGENQARRAEGVKRAEAAQAEADRVLRTVQAELATLPPRMAQSERAIEQLDSQVIQYNDLVRAGDLQFQAGRRSLTQLVQVLESRYVAQQRRADEGQRLLMSRLRYLILRGDFLAAMGLTPK